MHIEENAIFLTIFPITRIDAFELVWVIILKEDHQSSLDHVT
jgi:hypothetical protein